MVLDSALADIFLLSVVYIFLELPSVYIKSYWFALIEVI